MLAHAQVTKILGSNVIIVGRAPYEKVIVTNLLQ